MLAKFKMLAGIWFILVFANSFIPICIRASDKVCEQNSAADWAWPCEYENTKMLCNWLEKPKVESLFYWRKASPTSSCDQPSACRQEFKIELTRRAESNFNLSMELSSAIIYANVTSEENISISEVASRNQSVVCLVDSGYQAEVWMAIEMVRIKGKLRLIQRKHFLSFQLKPKCLELEGSINMPLLANNGQLSGPVECRQKPSVNVTEKYFYSNHNKIVGGCKFDLANSALDKMLKSLPPRNMNILTTAKGCGKKIYVRAMCFNIGENYKFRCQACIKHARENILIRGRNAHGLNWRLEDCYLRLEFFHFD